MQKLSHPKGMYILLCAEMPELFGRFGIIALLVLYLTKSLHFTDAKAFVIYSTFIALVYITPILGGFLSDRFLGKQHAIILGSIIMALGNLFLVLPNANMVCLWPGYNCYR